jgi:pimeloyl-ACP methyl ester carboxylesterase
VFGAPLHLRRGQLFGRELPAASARGYADRVTGPAVPRVMWQLLRHHTPELPVGDAPVLVLGSADDRVVPRRALERVARRYGGAPLLFPGMGHDLMLDGRWPEPIDAILDWLEKTLRA